jgi:hypothetical protein
VAEGGHQPLPQAQLHLRPKHQAAQQLWPSRAP